MLLIWDRNAWEDYLRWQTQDRQVRKRINTLIVEVMRHGNAGMGKPEPLNLDFARYWSGLFTDEHRLVYELAQGEVRIASCRHHSIGASPC